LVKRAAGAEGAPVRVPKRKVRYAVVGLGHIAQSAVLPAFEGAAVNSELTALVSDDPVKLQKLGRKYAVDHLYPYEEFDRALAVVDAVFIALPNSLHRAYTEAAAAEGVHVLCEKPMAMSVEDCEAMIEACERSNVKLMIGYRLHFEKATLTAIDIVQKRIGEPRIFSGAFTHDVDRGNVRTEEGEGGPLYDLGIYCLNACRALFKSEPEEVFAWEASRKDPRFASCPEMATVSLRFPEHRLASFTCSFGASGRSWYEVIGTKGAIRVEPAYNISKDLVHHVSKNEHERTRVFKKRDQFAAELVYFSGCILNDREPEPSGAEGLADVRVLRAIEKSADDGRPVKLPPLKRRAGPTLRQEIERPAHGKAELVHVEEPHVS
jgi:predicted dehydrogenase